MTCLSSNALVFYVHATVMQQAVIFSQMVNAPIVLVFSVHDCAIHPIPLWLRGAKMRVLIIGARPVDQRFTRKISSSFALHRRLSSCKCSVIDNRTACRVCSTRGRQRRLQTLHAVPSMYFGVQIFEAPAFR